MFQVAPINQGIYRGTQIKVDDSKATLTLEIGDKYFHAAEAMHGSVYFKLLDDAAYFAAASLVDTHFILTKSYTIHFIRPVGLDKLRAEGAVVKANDYEILAKSEIFNQNGKLVAHGSGVFVKGPKKLQDLPGYPA